MLSGVCLRAVLLCGTLHFLYLVIEVLIFFRCLKDVNDLRPCIPDSLPQSTAGRLSSAKPNAVKRWPAEKWTVVRRAVIGGTAETSTNEDVAYILRCLSWPTVQTYSALKRKLVADSSGEWLAQFLRADGLTLLIKALQTLCDSPGPRSVLDTVLQLECVGSVRAVMNSQTGLEYIIENRDFTRKLAAGRLRVRDSMSGLGRTRRRLSREVFSI